MKKKILIFGGGEIALLAKYYFNTDSDYEVTAFVVDDEFAGSESLEGLPLIAFTESKKRYPATEYSMHVALSYAKLNQIRETKYLQAKNSGYSLPSYVSSRAVVSGASVIGDNCFILEQQNIQPYAKIGNNVMLWSGNHIGHGTKILDHSYLASHVVVSGNCQIGQRCFIGVNATIKDFTNIGNDVFVGMNASVTKNISDGAIVLGANSDVLPADNRKSLALKKSYFGL